MQPQPPPEMLSFGGSSSRMFDAGGGEQAAEAASPISSRPPATTGISFDELASIDHDQYHNQLGGSSSNRWPRQETLALLKIRSEMDAAFRDATLKGPLWDDVSRKLGELGYVRSAKKCKEKFENVHKYYKRTKEGRAARQDGKTYRFFTQLEAMQPPPATASTVAAPPPVIGMSSAGGVMQSGGSGRGQPFAVYSTTTTTTGQVFSAQLPASAAAQTTGISFSSDSATSDSEDDIMSGEDQGEEGLDDRPASSNPKRKRSSSGSGSWKAAGKRGRMMDFFEGLMKKVMQKQEAMQQRLLETIEKREEDRLMREESWKQHEAARFSREQQLAAQERAMAASRDAAIVSFIHKITGQTIQLPPQPQPAAPAPMMTPASAPLQSWQHQSIQQPQTNTELVIRQQQVISQMPPPPRPPPVVSSEVIMAIPERQIPPPSSQAGQELLATSSGGEAGTSSSRWPKTEVLALIKLRSNLENQYQEAGPKGPLWEEISAGMQRMGYNRSSKRCKEKWENINKYFKKVKESNKKRPEDAKTCPYFNELDALYQRKKLVGGGSSSSTMIVQFQQQQYQFGMAGQEDSTTAAAPPPPGAQQQGSHVVLAAHIEPGTSEGASDGTHGQVQPHNNTGGSGKPEDTMTEQKQLDLGEEYSNNYQDNELCAEDEDIDEDDLCEKESKLGYKIDEFQRPPTNNKNGGTSSSSSSFNITMVQ